MWLKALWYSPYASKMKILARYGSGSLFVKIFWTILAKLHDFPLPDDPKIAKWLLKKSLILTLTLTLLYTELFPKYKSVPSE